MVQEKNPNKPPITLWFSPNTDQWHLINHKIIIFYKKKFLITDKILSMHTRSDQKKKQKKTPQWTTDETQNHALGHNHRGFVNENFTIQQHKAVD